MGIPVTGQHVPVSDLYIPILLIILVLYIMAYIPSRITVLENKLMQHTEQCTDMSISLEHVKTALSNIAQTQSDQCKILTGIQDQLAQKEQTVMWLLKYYYTSLRRQPTAEGPDFYTQVYTEFSHLTAMKRAFGDWKTQTIWQTI